MRTSAFLRALCVIAMLFALASCAPRPVDLPESARASPTIRHVLDLPMAEAPTSKAVSPGSPYPRTAAT